jgi:hypothetical protein
MSTKEQYHELFVATFEKLDLSHGHLAKWMSLEDTKQTRESVRRKLCGKVTVTVKDVAFIQMLDLMAKNYDLKSVVFSENGKIKQLKSKPRPEPKPKIK